MLTTVMSLEAFSISFPPHPFKNVSSSFLFNATAPGGTASTRSIALFALSTCRAAVSAMYC